MNKLITLARFFLEYLSDLIFAIRFNTYSPFEEKNRRIFYRIVILSHTVEKGLSLPKTRSFFGREKIAEIKRLIAEYDPKFSPFPLEMAHGAFVAYLNHHADLPDPDGFLAELRRFCEDPKFAGIESRGGVKRYLYPPSSEPENVERYSSFLINRYSCRNYRNELVPRELIERILRCAQAAPSQCNRQSTKIHCFQDKAKIERLLELQAGSIGFHREVYNLFIVSSEMTAWGGFGQRNQAYVDGALFAQTLLLSCHAHGVFTCPLNLAVANQREREIKEAAGIHPRERLIMMIAFGFSDHQEAKFANSPRLGITEVLTFH